MLRASLQTSARQTTSLRDEIDLVRRYAALMQARYAERVTVTWDVAPEAGDAEVPAMLLQPLLENAFEHGVEPSLEPVQIHIAAQRTSADLCITVRNSASTLAINPGGGVTGGIAPGSVAPGGIASAGIASGGIAPGGSRARRSPHPARRPLRPHPPLGRRQPHRGQIPLPPVQRRPRARATQRRQAAPQPPLQGRAVCAARVRGPLERRAGSCGAARFPAADVHPRCPRPPRLPPTPARCGDVPRTNFCIPVWLWRRLGVLGFNLGGIWAMLATVLGLVAIGFVAVWSVLSNTLCMVIILICRPFDIGDDIEFAGEPVQGKVIDLNFIYTTLRGADGGLVQIPNNLFLQKVIKRRRGQGGVSLAHQLSSDHPAAV